MFCDATQVIEMLLLSVDLCKIYNRALSEFGIVVNAVVLTSREASV